MTDEKIINVQVLMEEVWKRVRERIEKGEISEDEIKEVSEKPLSIPPNIEDLLDEIKHLAEAFEAVTKPLNELWVPHRPTPQSGLKGKIITLVQKIFSPLTRILLATQMDYNAQVVRSFNDLKVYLARVTDLTTNLAYRHYLVKIQGEMEQLKDTQMRLFRLVLRSMNQHRKIRKDLRTLKKDIPMKRVAQILSSPGEAPPQAPSTAVTSEDALYLSFEDLHRGNRAEIMERQRIYLPYLKKRSRVLDIGCGRGEFLELLQREGVTAKGIDINATMVTQCREQGLDVTQEDAITHLSRVAPGFYEGIFCGQVIEHLSWPTLLHLLRLSHEKLASHGILIMETINPQCLTTFCGAFYLDPTHTKPVHPLTLQFACKATGFSTADLLYTSPYPDEMKLKEVDFFRRTGDISDKLINVLNDNVMQLNELLYAPQDYAVLATKGDISAS